MCKDTIETKNVLLDKIRQHNEEYRQGAPTISDREYDLLVQRLQELDPNNEWFRHIEPSLVSVRRKATLPIPMKSLNKCKDLSSVIKWYKSLGLNENTTLVCMPKFDGLSLLFNEQTEEAYSRGGTENEGQDCTAHTKVACVMKNPAFKYTFGEFVINRQNWERYFSGKQSTVTGLPYKSPRNTAAGFLNRDTPCEELKHVDFYRYGVDEWTLQSYHAFSDLCESLCESYHQPFLYHTIQAKDLNEETLKQDFCQWNKLYPIDGIVIYINDINLWETIGRHQTTGNPLYAIAYKHPDFTDSFETTVKDISWKVSKSGALKPVVNIETVNTGDCNMENPTGYNAGWINNREIAKGAKILVTRSGGVIPKILSVIAPAPFTEQMKLWDDMAECPHCGAPTKWNDAGIELCCTNPHCRGIQLAKIVFFYLTCGAENMGEETLAKIYNAGATSIPKMLDVTFNELIKIEGFGESVSNSVLANNRKIMNGMDMATLMQASDCFMGIGKVKAQKILDEMTEEARKSFYAHDYTYFAIEEPKFKELSKTQQCFILGINSFFRFLIETEIPVLPTQPKEVNANGPCEGMKVCVSGFRDNALDEFIKQNGGQIVSGVSKNTTHLIVRDRTATSAKIDKAQTLGIHILSKNEFSALFNINNTFTAY